MHLACMYRPTSNVVIVALLAVKYILWLEDWFRKCSYYCFTYLICLISISLLILFTWCGGASGTYCSTHEQNKWNLLLPRRCIALANAYFFWFLFDYVLAFCCILLLQPHEIVTATPLVFMPGSLNFEILLLPLNVCQLNVMLLKIFAKKTCFNHFFNGTTSIHISNHNHLSIPLQSSINHVF